MKCFIIAAVSADGFISPEGSRDKASTGWTSREDTAFFVQKTKEAGVVVMGANTYRTIGKPLKDRLTIVYAKEGEFPEQEGLEITQADPNALLANLEKRGYREVALIGGAATYTNFLEAGAVDRAYITIEPVFFGKGLSLFTKPVEQKMRFISSEKLGEHTILLEYGVLPLR